MAAYDAFISYSHSTDDRLAPAIRDGLQKLAKPWNKRRALNIFLDQSSLEISAGLKDSLHSKLEGTEWLILLLSENSARSEWVGEEIANWAASKPANRIALVQTDGELYWGDGDWDWERSTAAPRALSGVYSEEPLWLDLRKYRDEPDLDIRSNSSFKDDLATVAAPLHGKSKEELVGEDLVQFRRSKRLRRAAIAGLAMLTVIALGLAYWANRERRIATSRQLAASAENATDTRLDRGLLLAVDSWNLIQTEEAKRALFAALVRRPGLIRIIGAHEVPVTAVTTAPIGGPLIASGDESGLVALWKPDGAEEWTRRDLPRAIEGEVENLTGVGGLAISPRADRLAWATVHSYGQDGILEMWDLVQERKIWRQGKPQQEHGEPASALSFGGRDGRYLAGFNSHVKPWASTVMVYRVEDGKKLAELVAIHDIQDSGAPMSIAFSEDYRLASAQDTGTVFEWQWDPESEELSEAKEVLRSPVSNRFAPVAYRPGGGLTAAFQDAGGVTTLEMVGAGRQQRPQQIRHPVRVLAYSVDGKLLASGATDGSLMVFGGGYGDSELDWQSGIAGLGFEPSGERIVTGSIDGTVVVWDVNGKPTLAEAVPLPGPVCALGAGGRALLAAPGGPTVWDIQRGEPSSLDLALPSGACEAGGERPTLAIGPEGAVASEIIGAEGPATLEIVSDEVVALRDMLALVQADVGEMEGSVYSLALSERPPRVAAYAVGGQGDVPAQVFYWVGPDKLLHDEDLVFESVTSATFSADGRRLARALAPVRDAEASISVIDADTRRELHVSELVESAQVSSLAFSPSGEWLAAGLDDGTVRVFEVDENGEPEEAQFALTLRPFGPPLRGHHGPVTGIAFYVDEADQRLRLASSSGREAFIWHFDVKAWIDFACWVANREVTEAERENLSASGSCGDPVRPVSRIASTGTVVAKPPPVVNTTPKPPATEAVAATDPETTPTATADPEASVLENSAGEEEVDARQIDPSVVAPPAAPPPDLAAPIRVGGDVKPPVKIKAPSPRYTRAARQARIEGDVIIEAIIDPQGNVTNVEILKGLPMGLDQAAIDAVRKWKFEPTRLNGEPVAVRYVLTINFRL